MKVLSKLTQKWFGKETKWAIKDEQGDWWLVSTENKKKDIEELPRKDFQFSPKERLTLIIIGALLGASLAINVYYFLLCSV